MREAVLIVKMFTIINNLNLKMNAQHVLQNQYMIFPINNVNVKIHVRIVKKIEF